MKQPRLQAASPKPILIIMERTAGLKKCCRSSVNSGLKSFTKDRDNGYGSIIFHTLNIPFFEKGCNSGHLKDIEKKSQQ